MMKKETRIVVCVAVLALAVAGTAKAQIAPGPTAGYAVKFVCGTQYPSPLRPPAEPPVKPGNYATSIDIESFGASIGFTTIISVANGSTVNGPAFSSLSVDQTIDITCADIARAVGPTLRTFITGFVNILPTTTSSSSLPAGALFGVTAVYSSQGCAFRPQIGISAGFTTCAGPTTVDVVPQQTNQFIVPVN
jgi:hypothetical protein